MSEIDPTACLISNTAVVVAASHVAVDDDSATCSIVNTNAHAKKLDIAARTIDYTGASNCVIYNAAVATRTTAAVIIANTVVNNTVAVVAAVAPTSFLINELAISVWYMHTPLEPLPQILNPFSSNTSFDLSSRSGATVYTAISQPLDEIWDGKMIFFLPLLFLFAYVPMKATVVIPLHLAHKMLMGKIC